MAFIGGGASSGIEPQFRRIAAMADRGVAFLPAWQSRQRFPAGWRGAAMQPYQPHLTQGIGLACQLVEGLEHARSIVADREHIAARSKRSPSVSQVPIQSSS